MLLVPRVRYTSETTDQKWHRDHVGVDIAAPFPTPLPPFEWPQLIAKLVVSGQDCCHSLAVDPSQVQPPFASNMTTETQSRKVSPSAELSCRRSVAKSLYVVVNNAAFEAANDVSGSVVITPPSGDVLAKLRFTCNDLTKSNLRTHLIHSNCPALKTRFISVFDDEGAYGLFSRQGRANSGAEVALRANPFWTVGPNSNEPTGYHATKLVLDSSTLQAGWMDTPSGRLPVWFEHDDPPLVPGGMLNITAHATRSLHASLWVCIDEIRDIFQLRPNEGEKGEWLACGSIPRSMVTARVMLQHHRRRPDLAHPVPREPEVPSRDGSVKSIRSISSEEQQEHTKMQILRNKAAREELRALAVTARPSPRRESPLLRQAVKNRRVLAPPKNFESYTDVDQTALKPNGRSHVVKVISNAEAKPQQRTNLSPIDSTKDHDTSSHYISVRSPKLREELEQLQDSTSAERPTKAKHVGHRIPGKPTKKQMKPVSPHNAGILYDRSVGGSSPDRKRDVAAVQVSGQALYKSCEIGFVAEKANIASLARNHHTVPNTVFCSKGLLRVQAEQRTAESRPLGPREEAKPAPKAEPEDILDYALDVVSSVLDEITQHTIEHSSLELSLSNKRSISGHALSMIDKEPTAGESMSDYEADVSDNQGSALKRTAGGRTRRRSPHSRLTTPLSMYDVGSRTPTVG